MTVNITLPDCSYDIHIDTLKMIQLKGKVVVVTNPTVSGYHLLIY